MMMMAQFPSTNDFYPLRSHKLANLCEKTSAFCCGFEFWKRAPFCKSQLNVVYGYHHVKETFREPLFEETRRKNTGSGKLPILHAKLAPFLIISSLANSLTKVSRPSETGLSPSFGDRTSKPLCLTERNLKLGFANRHRQNQYQQHQWQTDRVKILSVKQHQRSLSIYLSGHLSIYLSFYLSFLYSFLGL